MTEVQKAELAAQLEARAAEYATDPQKGLAAGYHPVQAPRIAGRAEISRQPQRKINAHSEYGGWLRGVAQRDVPAGVQWQVHDWLGEGPTSATLTIL